MLLSLNNINFALQFFFCNYYLLNRTFNQHYHLNVKHTFVNFFIKSSSKLECHEVLNKWNSYYAALSEKHQKAFVKRTLLFLKTTHFSATEGLELTTEMKLVISSAFIEITFGLKQPVLSLFKTVLVSPPSNTSTSKRVLFNGDENTLTKHINLPWPAVKNSFTFSDAGFNFALQEFSHCLIIEHAKSSYFSKAFNDMDLNAWKELASKKMPLIHEGKYTIFKNYEGTDLTELFAATLAIFFEQPHEFYSYAPTFYRTTAKVLKQDPRNGKNPK
ncbi:zinc-dependent peptidase [Maribacter ulvicola]|uniref:Mlc titration factor MtfA, regulates ptsG expression n=1 Tax=Maribacter ulvicola TaxID=228959 RepID=A0A1N6Y1E5_9FLAO|nr:zinc-dependent peptidase [Maribacter ulvicola]SIR08353.1 Mlc titration factor MtfA, regulates ptsG expression [Maribacter ulvicola]